MNGADVMMRLFGLTRIYLKTNDLADKQVLKTEIDLLQQEFAKDKDVPSEVKQSFIEILRQYHTIYESDDLVEKTEAEERVREKLEQIKKLIKR